MEYALEKSNVLEAMQQDTINDIFRLKQKLKAQPALPSPQEMHFSEEHGVPYYYNPDTGVSSWEPPMGDEQYFDDKMTLLDIVDTKESDSQSADMIEKNDGYRNDSLEDTSVRSASTYSRRVEDDLLKKGELYQNRREDLRRRDQEKFAEEFTGKPQITRYAEKLYSSKGDCKTANLTIAERSKRMLEAKRAKEEKLRKEIEEKETRQMRTTPEISKKSRQLHGEQGRGVEAMLQWEQERHTRKEMRQKEFAAVEEAHLTYKPSVTRQSEKILRDSGRGSAEDGRTVEERLLEYDERKRLKHIQAVQKLNMEARERAAKPRTRASDARLANGRKSVSSDQQQPVSDRLYIQAEAQRAERIRRQEAAVSEQNRESFKPRINKTSERLAQKSRPDNVPVESLLEYQGHLYSYKQQIRQNVSKKEAVMRSNAPKMNPNSAKILQESGDCEGATRLTRPIGTVKKKTLDTIDRPTFQPSITRKSRQMFEEATYSSYDDSSLYRYEDDGEDIFSVQTSGGNHGPQRVYERSQKWLQEKQLRMLREKAAREEEELRGCTFKPKVKTTPRERYDGCDDQSYGDDGYAYSSSNGGKSLAERQAEWQRKRDMKLEAERRARDEALLAECPFTPMVSSNGLADRHNSVNSQDSPTSPARARNRLVPDIKPRHNPPGGRVMSPPMPPPGRPPDSPYSDSDDYGLRRSPGPPPSGPYPELEPTSYDYEPSANEMSSPPPKYLHADSNQHFDRYEDEKEDSMVRYGNDSMYPEDEYSYQHSDVGDPGSGYSDRQQIWMYGHAAPAPTSRPPDNVANLSAYFSSAVIGSSSCVADSCSSPGKATTMSAIRGAGSHTDYHDNYASAYELDESGEPYRAEEAEYHAVSRTPRREGTCDHLQNKLDLL